MLTRHATLSDIEAALALIEGGYRGEGAKRGWTHEADLLGGQRTDRLALSDIIADPKQTLLLAERESELVGCVVVADRECRDGVRIAYLGMLTVRPDLQNRGLGRALIAEAERHAREVIGADLMEMTVISRRIELVDWYARRGYTPTGRREPFPLDDLRLGIPKTRDLEFLVLARRLNEPQ